MQRPRASRSSSSSLTIGTSRRSPRRSRANGKALLVTSSGTSDLTGKACSPNTIHWSYDTWALAHSTGKALVQSGADTWFFLTADYAFGYAIERDVEAVVLA